MNAGTFCLLYIYLTAFQESAEMSSTIGALMTTPIESTTASLDFNDNAFAGQLLTNAGILLPFFMRLSSTLFSDLHRYRSTVAASIAADSTVFEDLPTTSVAAFRTPKKTYLGTIERNQQRIRRQRRSSMPDLTTFTPMKTPAIASSSLHLFVWRATNSTVRRTSCRDVICDTSNSRCGSKSNHRITANNQSDSGISTIPSGIYGDESAIPTTSRQQTKQVIEVNGSQCVQVMRLFVRNARR